MDVSLNWTACGAYPDTTFDVKDGIGGTPADDVRYFMITIPEPPTAPSGLLPAPPPPPPPVLTVPATATVDV